jgi:hypothetical protein
MFAEGARQMDNELKDAGVKQVYYTTENGYHYERFTR